MVKSDKQLFNIANKEAFELYNQKKKISNQMWYLKSALYIILQSNVKYNFKKLEHLP